MCESNAYLVKDGKEELVMESVGVVKIQGGTVTAQEHLWRRNLHTG